jgi:RsiW-degrading membrane proteinase PrsW (M82 family)
LTFLNRFIIIIFGLFTLSELPVGITDSLSSLIVLTGSFFIVFAFFYFADAYEREEFKYLIWSLLWGGFVAYGLVSIIFYLSDSIYESTWLAALTEEFFKLLGLFILFKKGIVTWWTDGLVVGGLIGLGFTYIEDIHYVFESDEPLLMAFYRSLSSVFAHSFFSGIAGAIFVYLILKKERLLAFSAIIISTFIHAIWNAAIIYEVKNVFVMQTIGPPFLLVLLTLFLRRIERKTITFVTHRAISSDEKLKYPPSVYFDLKSRTKYSKKFKTYTNKRNFRRKLSKEIHELISKYAVV